jgi:hypothetical protein
MEETESKFNVTVSARVRFFRDREGGMSVQERHVRQRSEKSMLRAIGGGIFASRLPRPDTVNDRPTPVAPPVGKATVRS